MNTRGDRLGGAIVGFIFGVIATEPAIKEGHWIFLPVALLMVIIVLWPEDTSWGKE